MSYWQKNKLPFTHVCADGSIATLKRPVHSVLNAARAARIMGLGEQRKKLLAELDEENRKRMEKLGDEDTPVEIQIKEREEFRKMSAEDRRVQAREDQFFGLDQPTLVARCCKKLESKDGEVLPDAILTNPQELQDTLDESLIEELATAIWKAWTHGVQERQSEHRGNL